MSFRVQPANPYNTRIEAKLGLETADPRILVILAIPELGILTLSKHLAKAPPGALKLEGRLLLILDAGKTVAVVADMKSEVKAMRRSKPIFHSVRTFFVRRRYRHAVHVSTLVAFLSWPALCDENYDKLPQGTQTPARSLNSKLPEWVRFSGVLRSQVEGRTGDGYREGDDFSYLVTRLRLNLDVQPTSWFRVFLQGQDSRVGGLDSPRSDGFKDSMDLQQGYLEFKAGDKQNWMNFRAGRQELFFGASRLIGDAFWGNTGMPVFDGARLGLGTDGVRVDLLAFAPVDVHRNRPNRRRNGENLYGAYGSMTKLLPNTTIEPYLFWKTLEDVTATTQQPGHANVYTSGIRWATELPSGPEFSAEWARQTGNRSTDNISAWYGYGYGGYRFKKYKTQPHVRTEYGYATGDEARSGAYGTFDHLYFGTQGILGIADLIGLQNIKYFRNSFDIKFGRIQVIVDHHFLWLASKRDGLYGVNGLLTVTPPPGGAASGDVGHEADIVFVYTPDPKIRIAAGLGHLFPGQFLKENSPGSGTSSPYVSLTYRF